MNFPKAAAEFRKELEISPNDLLSHSQLGYIAMKQHDFPEAETELLRASTLAPQDPDIDFMLGQLYYRNESTGEGGGGAEAIDRVDTRPGEKQLPGATRSLSVGSSLDAVRESGGSQAADPNFKRIAAADGSGEAR